MSVSSAGPICAMLRRALPDSLLSTSDGAVGVGPSVQAVADFLSGMSGTLWVIGNGGSAASAMHICADWRMAGRRARTLTDVVALSGHANDFGFNAAYARLVEHEIADGDSLLFLSVSGASSNLLQVAELVGPRTNKIMSLVGKRGAGPLTALSHRFVAVHSDEYPLVEYIHLGLVIAAQEAVR